MTNGERWEHEHGIKTQGATRAKSLAQPTPRKPKPRPAPLPLRKPERAGDVCVLCLPLPPQELHPNARVHFQNKARHVKAARNIAAMLAQIVGLPSPWAAARIDAKFYMPRVRDADGLWTWLKAYLDGFQGILVRNDSCVQLGDMSMVTGKEAQGRKEVELQVTRLDAA